MDCDSPYCLVPATLNTCLSCDQFQIPHLQAMQQDSLEGRTDLRLFPLVHPGLREKEIYPHTRKLFVLRSRAEDVTCFILWICIVIAYKFLYTQPDSFQGSINKVFKWVSFFHFRRNQLLMKFGLNSLQGAPSGESESCLKQDWKASHSCHCEHRSGQKLNTNGRVEI